MKRKLLGIVIILLLGCPLCALQVSAQEVIFVARHTDPQMLLRLDAPIQDDTPLSETGRTQAEVLTARLKDAGITAIYTSKTARGRFPMWGCDMIEIQTIKTMSN